MGKEISETEYLRGLYKAALDQKAALERMEQALTTTLERHDHESEQRDRQIRLLERCARSLRVLVVWFVVVPITLLSIWFVVVPIALFVILFVNSIVNVPGIATLLLILVLILVVLGIIGILTYVWRRWWGA